MDRVRTVSDQVLVAATPEALYAMVSDPGRMHRWSPENTGASTTGSLSAGAEFDGTNRRGRARWVTRSVVTAAEPGVRFAFRVHRIGVGRPLVPARNASWEYHFAPTDGGTLVTETWTDDRPWPDALARAFDKVATGTTFAEFQQRNIRRTLDRLKADAEQAEAGVVARLRVAGCVFAEDEARLLMEAGGDLESLLARRVAGEPLEQVLGWAQFCGLRVPVEPGVFVPRRRTELLVREAVALHPSVVLDLCCGSGAIGLAVVTTLAAGGAPHRPVELHAADVDPAAVACARRAVAGVGGQVHLGDLDDPLPADLRGRVDVLVVNAPYVPTDAVALMPPEARVHEHRVALDGGADGLDVQRRVAEVARRWVRPGGSVLIETSVRQADRTAELLQRNGFRVRIARDEQLDGTVAVGILGHGNEPGGEVL